MDCLCRWVNAKNGPEQFLLSKMKGNLESYSIDVLGEVTINESR